MRPDVPALFHILADLPPEARERYWTDHDVDPDTRRELEELLTYDSEPGDRLSFLVGNAAHAVLTGDATGFRCGAFRLVSVIGTGGMGVVYLAERADGEVKQRAAVKLMQPGWSLLQREQFLREREILAGLTHPNIAHLLDAGHLPDGQPYLAMEYVEGKPIDQYCKDFSVRQKTQLFLKVCGAVAYLHRNSIIHRDLKPGNILVTALGEPKLLDFGIAKILDLTGDRTVTHLRMLTPDYASPEQMIGGTIGSASDIYSLGAVLQYLITGNPFGMVRSGESIPELKGDLGVVLRTATRHEPKDRYATVEEFTEDVQACLDSRPIRARRRDWLYRTKKFVQRHSLSVTVCAALSAALVGAAGLWLSFSSASAIQELRPKRLTSNTPELPIDAAAISPDGRTVAWSDALGIHLYYPATGVTRLLAGTSGHVLLQWLPDNSGVHTQALTAAGTVKPTVVSVWGTVRDSTALEALFRASPDGKYRASAAPDGQRIILQEAAGQRTREVWQSASGTLSDFQWSPNSAHIAVLSSHAGASALEMIDVVGGHRNLLISPEKKLALDAMAWPAQDRIIVAIQEEGHGVNSQGSSNLWEIRPGIPEILGQDRLRKLTNWTDFPIRPGSLTTDGTRLVFIRSFRQRDVYIGELQPAHLRMGAPRRLTLDLGDDYPTAWTRDSKSVVLTSDRNGPSAIFVQNIDQQTADQLVFGPSTQIIARVSADGKWVLFYGREGAKRGIMRAPVTGGRAEFLFEAPGIMGLRCSSAGPCTVATRQNGAVIVNEFDPVKGSKGREIYRDSSVRFAGPDISPDGKWLATPSGSKIIFRSFATGEVIREIPVLLGENATNLVNMDYAADGKGFFAGETTPAETRQLYVDLSGKASVLWRQAGRSSVWGVPSPDGRYLAMMVYTDDSNVYMIENF